MVGWHHRINGHEFEQTPGDSEGQRSLSYCSPWGRRVGYDLVNNNKFRFSDYGVISQMSEGILLDIYLNILSLLAPIVPVYLPCRQLNRFASIFAFKNLTKYLPM